MVLLAVEHSSGIPEFVWLLSVFVSPVLLWCRVVFPLCLVYSREPTSRLLPAQTDKSLTSLLYLVGGGPMVRKKVDARVRTLIENGVKSNHRSTFVLVGDYGKDQASKL